LNAVEQEFEVAISHGSGILLMRSMIHFGITTRELQCYFTDSKAVEKTYFIYIYIYKNYKLKLKTTTTTTTTESVSNIRMAALPAILEM
jgi:hypothetical protein